MVQRGRWAGCRAAPAACDRAYSLARRIRPRSPSATRFWDNGRGGVFIPGPWRRRQGRRSACARQVFRMLLPLPLLWSAVIRALERLGHPGGLGAHKTRPLAGRFPREWAFSSGVCPKRAASGQPAAAPACSPRLSVAGNAAPWWQSGLELQFADAQDSIALSRRGRSLTRV